MNLPQTEIPHPETRDAWRDERTAWLAEQTSGLLYRDNLIYLPFAAHLSEEDAEAETFAKAA